MPSVIEPPIRAPRVIPAHFPRVGAGLPTAAWCVHVDSVPTDRVDSGPVAASTGTSLQRKLGIADGSRVALVRAPEGFDRTLKPLPEGARLVTTVRGPQDVVLFFVTRRAELQRRFAALARSVAPAGGLWIAWPKRSAGVATDLNEKLVRQAGIGAGLEDNKVCPIDDAWSGLRFVYRSSDT